MSLPNKKYKILLVEDDINLSFVIKDNLEYQGFEVQLVENGELGYEAFTKEKFDICVFDIMLPKEDGLTLAKKVREMDKEVPIIFLTAKSMKEDTIEGFMAGADDYLTKPFNLEELLLRVNNLLKRSTEAGAKEKTEYSFSGNTINFITYKASGKQGEFQLTKKEVLLLKLLIERQNEVVSRNQILQTVWGYDVYPSTRTIDNFILSFRKYFEEDPRNPKHFYSVRGVGYKFTP